MALQQYENLFESTLRIPWTPRMAHRTNISVSSVYIYIYILQNWLCFCPATLRGTLDWKIQYWNKGTPDNDGRNLSQMSSERRQWLLEELEKDFHFAKRFGQQRPERDMQIEDIRLINRSPLETLFLILT